MKNKEKYISKVIKTAVLAAFTVVCAFSLTGCIQIKITKPLSEEALFEINDTECSVGTAILRLLEAKEEYENAEDSVLWTRKIGDTTLAEYVMNTVKDELLKYTAAQEMAADLTVYLSNEEVNAAKDSAMQLYEHMVTSYNLINYDVTLEDAEDLYIKKAYYDKVYEKLSENIYMEISESDTKAIEIDYVFIPADDGIEAAEQMRNEMKSGTEFAEVCADYGYEVVLNNVETKGSMPEAFENSAYALKDGEISEVVVTQSGYYIIYCIEDYLVTESQANSNKIIYDKKKENFQEAYEEFAKTNKMRFDNSKWTELDFYTLGE